jgi:hypothetical protein
MGRFHCKLVARFAPMVVRYVELMEHSISQSIDRGFAKEKWEMRKCVPSSISLFNCLTNITAKNIGNSVRVL